MSGQSAFGSRRGGVVPFSLGLSKAMSPIQDGMGLLSVILRQK